MSASAAPAVYPARQIKRHRATAAEMEERYRALLTIVRDHRPMTVRQVFYQATVKGVIDKTENGYDKVCTALGLLRRARLLPYDWIADNTRWMRRPQTFSGIEAAIDHTARTYRRALWDDADAYVEIWLEKDALAGVVVDVTDEFDVPLMVSRGYSSLSFLHSAASMMAAQDRPCFIYHFGDFDPSGVNAAEKIEETLRELAPDADIAFERAAVTPEMIRIRGPRRGACPARWRRARHCRRRSSSSSGCPSSSSAVSAGSTSCIEEHIDHDRLAKLKVAEASERQALAAFSAAQVRGQS